MGHVAASYECSSKAVPSSMPLGIGFEAGALRLGYKRYMHVMHCFDEIYNGFEHFRRISMGRAAASCGRGSKTRPPGIPLGIGLEAGALGWATSAVRRLRGGGVETKQLYA